MLGPAAWSLNSSQIAGSCLVLDLGPHCILRESLQGFLPSVGQVTTRVYPASLERPLDCRTLIVPGAGAFPSTLFPELLDFVSAGGILLLESAAGFLQPLEFAEHQKILKQMFGVAICEPVDLWRESQTVPYVHYDWPHEILVRDFSRVATVASSQPDIIGRVSLVPVACKKRIGRGALIFLGSPLGPALRAGDREALAWLRALPSTI